MASPRTLDAWNAVLPETIRQRASYSTTTTFSMRLRINVGFMDLVELAVVVEWFSSEPDMFDDVDPPLPLVISFLVLNETGPKHVEFISVPTAYDVEVESPLDDELSRHHLLVSDHRVEKRYANRAESHDMPGAGQDARGPC